MPTINFTILTILGCGLVTLLSRVIPFVLLKKFTLPKPVLEYLSFVPIVIMSALWFDSLFIQNLGHLPKIDTQNLLASLPTLVAAVISKNLLVIVVVGIISLAVLRFLGF